MPGTDADDTDKVGSDMRSQRPGILDQITFRRFMALQSPKWGAEASRCMWKRQQDGRLVTVCVGLIAIVAMVGNLHRPATIGVVVGLAFFGLLAGFRAVSWWQRMNLAASKALGVEVGWKPGHAPPRSPDAYEKWCEKNALTPYSAA
jgi:hypothetical protein